MLKELAECARAAPPLTRHRKAALTIDVRSKTDRKPDVERCRSSKHTRQQRCRGQIPTRDPRR